MSQAAFERVVANPSGVATEVTSGVCEVIAGVLDRDAVTPTDNLMDDLDADSLDFLDIVFELEQRFGVEITRGALERAARGDMSEEEFAPGGVISEAGLARLRELLPESTARIGPGLRPRAILSLFTASTFARIVAAASERGLERGDDD